MLTKPYIIRGNNWAGSSVVKIIYGKKYVIAKCKTQPGSLKTIENDLNAFIRGGKINPNGLYYHLFMYVKAHPGNEFKVETLLENESGYLLLKMEQEQLEACRNDSAFLNNQINAHIPIFNEDTGMYGWITVNNVLNFNKWLKSRRTKRKHPKQSA